MVMDDLIVKPMSSISSVTLLNDLNIKDISFLQEKMVEVDIKKVIILIRTFNFLLSYSMIYVNWLFEFEFYVLYFRVWSW
jgi:hypothetical protein